MADTDSGPCKLQIWAAQTVVPAKPTFQRTSVKLPLPLRAAVSTAAFHVVLLFQKSSAGDSGWLHAALIKQSLGCALLDQPILAGRIRPRDDDQSVLEIVANDSGIRMVEATADATAAEFLAGGKNEASKLVFWEDIPEQHFQFHPLFYVQVTNFACGGYSIGFSCSLLLIDPFAAASFLRGWVEIHRTVVGNNDVSKYPLFYNLPFRGRPSTPLMRLTTRRPMADVVILSVKTGTCAGLDLEDVAEACVFEAEQEVGRKMKAEFGVLIKRTSPSDGKSESEAVVVSRSEVRKRAVDGFSVKKVRMWDAVGLGNVWLNEGEKVEYASCWMSSSSASDEGFLILFRDGSDVTKAVVLFP